MKTCRDIENLLPLYPEGKLNEDEKRAVEDHLAVCEKCRKELAYLQKAGQLVSDMTPVEEPPWFQQKIMAQVRKEAEKKSRAQRWFYPLRFRIPLQIAATVVIAVMAVYIYRSGEDRMNQVVPGARPPVVEMSKEETGPQPMVRQEAAKPAAPSDGAVLPQAVSREKGVERESDGGQPAKQSTALKSRPQPLEAAHTLRDDAPAEKKTVLPPVSEGRLKEQRAKQEEVSPVSGAVSRKDRIMEGEVSHSKDKMVDQAVLGEAKKKEAYSKAAPAAPQSMAASAGSEKPSATVSLRVGDVVGVADNIEKTLKNYDARLISRQALADRTILKILLPVPNKALFLSKLREFGQVHEKTQLSSESDQNITVILEILPF